MSEIRQEWLKKDYYSVLGVSPDAPESEVTKAYRSLARRLHPDHNPGDAAAEERFKEVSAAYDVIGDPGRRKQYDEVRRLAGGGNPFVGAGPAGGHSFQFSGAEGIGDLLGNLFGPNGGPFGAPGAPRRGPDREEQISLSFSEAVHGTTRPVASGERPDRAGVKVRIPAGVADGQRIRLRGRGAAGPAGGPAGDLYVIVRVDDHPIFGRDGDNLTITVPVSIGEAAMGARIAVPTFEGEPVTLKLAAGTQPGSTLRVRGRGLPTDRGTGDLLVTVTVAVPDKLNAAQRRALKDFEEATKGRPLREHLGVGS